MVETVGTHTKGVPSSALLSALSQAFSYPWEGIAQTTESLRDAAADSAFQQEIEQVLAASGAFEDRTAEQLAYTRLFIGSFKMEAPPYASYYLEEGRTLNGKVAAEVEAVYAQFGLQLDSKEVAPPDHLRYLLAFLALMANRREQTGEEAFADAYADFRDAFVLTWLDRCKELVDRYAEQPYYPALVALIVDVLTEDRAAQTAPEGE